MNRCYRRNQILPLRDAGILMLADLTEGRRRRVTVGADKAYDTQDFVATVRELQATPHVTQNNTNRRSALDERTTRHPGYRISLSKRWLVEKPFGWLKQIGGLRKVKLRGLARVDWLFVFGCAAYNLLRVPKLSISCLLTKGVECLPKLDMHVLSIPSCLDEFSRAK